MAAARTRLYSRYVIELLLRIMLLQASTCPGLGFGYRSVLRDHQSFMSRAVSSYFLLSQPLCCGRRMKEATDVWVGREDSEAAALHGPSHHQGLQSTMCRLLNSLILVRNP